jgi:hypothetical protein
VRKKDATTIGIGGWSSRPLGRRGPTYKTLKKTLELQFVKRANGMSSGFRKMRLVERSAPSETKKEIVH